MLREMGCSTFQYWKAAYRLNPWGESRADMRSEVQAQRILGGLSGAKEDSKPKPSYPYWDEKPDADQMLAWMNEHDKLAGTHDGGHARKDTA